MRLEYFFKILRSILGRKKFCHTRESFTMCPNWNSWSTTGTAFRFTFMKKRKIFPNLLLKHSYVSSNVCIMHSNLSILFLSNQMATAKMYFSQFENLKYAIFRLVWNNSKLESNKKYCIKCFDSRHSLRKCALYNMLIWDLLIKIYFEHLLKSFYTHSFHRS